MNFNLDNAQQDAFDQLSDQLDEIVSTYQKLLDEAEKEVDAAKLQAAIYRAKVVSLEAERDTLIATMQNGKFTPAQPVADQTALEKVIEENKRLSGELDRMQDRLKDADMRMLELETEIGGRYPANDLYEAPLPDFEDQKRTLLEMQEELDRLEEKLRKES